MWNTFRLSYLEHISCSTEILSENFTQLEKIAFAATNNIYLLLITSTTNN